MKIQAFQIENVKRVKAVEASPSPKGLTIIGGKNRQGKTSILDSIAYALGGERKRPTNLKREGSEGEPYLRVEMDNGLIVERKGKNTSLTVTDSKGMKGGQTLLNEFVSALAIDLPAFLEASGKEKGRMMLDGAGLTKQVLALEEDEETAYEERRTVARGLKKQRAHVDQLPYYEDAPDEHVSVRKLMEELNEIQDKNHKRSVLMRKLERREKEKQALIDAHDVAVGDLADARQAVKMAEKRVEERKKAMSDLDDAPEIVIPEGIPEGDVKERIQGAERVNEKVTANDLHAKADKVAGDLEKRHLHLEEEIEEIRDKKVELLEDADLPLSDLGVEAGELTYRGKAWDCMSSTEQIRVAASIVQGDKPDCRFVLLDRLEVFDEESLEELDKWLSDEDLQGIATRVSTGDECQIIIEDGRVQNDNA